VRALFVDTPPGFLEERRRLGHDTRDEMWEGVLHMVPPPRSRHQRLEARLAAVLVPLAETRGWEVMTQAGLYRPGAENDWRVPDLVIARRDHISERGVECRAEVVVEIRSPNDETYDKLPFYADVECQEVLVIDPATWRIELFVLRGGRLLAALPEPSGAVRLPSLDVYVTPLEDGLRLRGSDGDVDIRLP
jgi:Uma2 family endonuclease